jgi:hypothetical protein
MAIAEKDRRNLSGVVYVKACGGMWVLLKKTAPIPPGILWEQLGAVGLVAIPRIAPGL